MCDDGGFKSDDWFAFYQCTFYLLIECELRRSCDAGGS